jgi:hypothetical protein
MLSGMQSHGFTACPLRTLVEFPPEALCIGLGKEAWAQRGGECKGRRVGAERQGADSFSSKNTLSATALGGIAA